MAFTAAAKAALTWARSETSHFWKKALPGPLALASATTFSPRSALRAMEVTVAPSATRAATRLAPIP
jgi:hypothetical protein